MNSDRPLIASILFLAAGLGLIIGYCHGPTNVTAAYPFAVSMLHIDISLVGPAVPGGLLCIAIGLVLLAWAFIAAIVSQTKLLIASDDRPTERLLD